MWGKSDSSLTDVANSRDEYLPLGTLLSPVSLETLQILFSSTFIKNLAMTVYMTYVNPCLIDCHNALAIVSLNPFQEARTFQDPLIHHLVRQGMGLRLHALQHVKISTNDSRRSTVGSWVFFTIYPWL
jgi:hypothetical protein